MVKRYYYENDNGKEYCCTQKQWNYWNRKAIAEEKKKFKRWIDNSGMFCKGGDNNGLQIR